MQGINSSIIALMLLIIWDFIFLLLFIRLRKNKKIIKKILITSAVINFILITTLYYILSGIGVSKYNLKSDKIPDEFNGFKILQISDFHRGTFNGGVEAVIKKVDKIKPDIITLTGDLMDEGYEDTSSVQNLVAQLVKIAPVYSVSGNHDKWYTGFNDLQDMMSKYGVKNLENKKDVIKLGDEHISILGIADPRVWEPKQAEDYVKSNMKKLAPDNGFNLLLFHRANMFDTVKTGGYQLILSGHMHGGQFQIPFIGGLRSPHGEWFPKFTDGRYVENGSTMIVSRGLGNVVIIPRLLNPPELVLITLKNR